MVMSPDCVPHQRKPFPLHSVLRCGGLDADAQWQKLEDTLFSVTRSMDKGVPAVHQAIMSAFQEEGTASESSRRARFLQDARTTWRLPVV